MSAAHVLVVLDRDTSFGVKTLNIHTNSNEHARGEVIGEVGFFMNGTRTLNMDVLKDARLLRLTKNNMERLRRRAPSAH